MSFLVGGAVGLGVGVCRVVEIGLVVFLTVLELAATFLANIGEFRPFVVLSTLPRGELEVRDTSAFVDAFDSDRFTSDFVEALEGDREMSDFVETLEGVRDKSLLLEEIELVGDFLTTELGLGLVGSLALN